MFFDIICIVITICLIVADRKQSKQRQTRRPVSTSRSYFTNPITLEEASARYGIDMSYKRFDATDSQAYDRNSLIERIMNRTHTLDKRLEFERIQCSAGITELYKKAIATDVAYFKEAEKTGDFSRVNKLNSFGIPG